MRMGRTPLSALPPWRRSHVAGGVRRARAGSEGRADRGVRPYIGRAVDRDGQRSGRSMWDAAARHDRQCQPGNDRGHAGAWFITVSGRGQNRTMV